MFLMDIVIIYFIKYELDEFELNWMNVYVWYDVISVFVDYVVYDRDIVSSGKEIPVLRLLECVLFRIRSIQWCILTLLVHWIHIDEDYQLAKSRRRFIWPCPRFEIWANRNRTYGLTLCIWELYRRFEELIKTDCIRGLKYEMIGIDGWYMTGANLWF